jgi:hypothetical protein
VNVLSLAKGLDDMFLSDTNYFNGIENFPTWNEIYNIIKTEYFPKEDNDIYVYCKI